ncbi:substrate-binding domain-containing protein [Fimbriiglobus ruber]|uniref:Sugar ABC transporter n=1 Tax=Fimbriiglobus ruber TaxID=1908690 RepID=A0A225D0W2_9BACT|nr:substrate-binding domain-containing protein [Fimbriiglobus ruber]OWK34573.1 Sugar ABC transporter [Fimbriiglobus ruber]
MWAHVRALGVVAVAIGVAAIPACSGSKTTGGRPKVAVVTNCTAEFWSICEAGATKAGKDFDVDVIFRQPDKMEVSSQMEIVEAVLKQGISGIAVSVINPSEQTPDLRRISKQTSFLAMDNDAPESGRLCYIGIDNYEAGKAVGRLVKKAMPEGGTVAMFIGGTDSANAKARIGGVLDELAGQKDAKGPQYGKYELLDNEPKTDKGKEETAQDNAKDVLNKLNGKNKSVALVGLYAYNPKANILAVRAMKDKQFANLKLVGFDEDAVTLDAISKGDIVGTVVQDPFDYGYQAVKVLAAVARGDKSAPEKAKPTPYRVITKDGGPEETVDGIKVLNLKAADFAQILKDQVASAGK